MATVQATLDIMGTQEPLSSEGAKPEDLFILSYLLKLDQSRCIDQLYPSRNRGGSDARLAQL